MKNGTVYADRSSLLGLMEAAMRDLLESSERFAKEAKEANNRFVRDRGQAYDLYRTIQSLDPEYKFAGPVPDPLTQDAPIAKRLDLVKVREHMVALSTNDGATEYGTWTGLAERILLAKRSGRFAELRDYAAAQGWIEKGDEKAEAGLRHALHGMKQRKVITYTPGVGGRGGVFKLKDD